MPADDEDKGEDRESQPATESPPVALKPLLASEALMDDLAPQEPWAAASRVWTAVCGVSFALAGLTRLLGHASDSVMFECFALAGLALLVAAAPMGYVSRGSLMTLVGVGAALLGMASVGPAGVLSNSVGFWSVLHLLTAVGLPAALMFRARYRAYGGARTILFTALATTLPFVSYSVVAISQGPLPAQISAAVALVMIGLSSVGFMGSDTTALGTWLAGGVIVAVNAELVCETAVAVWAEHALWAEPGLLGEQGVLGSPLGSFWGSLWTASSLLAFTGATLLGALGVFTLLAGQHWSRARSVDLRRPTVQRERLDSIGDTWSTR
jgi:hypothetical protein